MTERVCLLDTRPLVRFFGSGLEHQAWAAEQWKEVRPPLLTCESVLAETTFLLKRTGRDTDALFALLERGVLRIAIGIEREQADLRLLMRYRNRPMSLAHACLVRLSEILLQHESAYLLTSILAPVPPPRPGRAPPPSETSLTQREPSPL